MDWGILVAVAGLGLAIMGGFAAWVIRFGKAEGALEEAKEAKALAISAKGELADFKERVAREYATAAMVAAVEGRVITAIDRLADRLDRILEHRVTPAPRTRRPVD